MHRPISPGWVRPCNRPDTEVPGKQQEASPCCTCGDCIAGFISPRMKWFLIRYAEILEGLLPRSLNVLERNTTEDRTSGADFLDLDVFDDLDHMPLSLKRSLKGSLRVMVGYCEVFGHIIECLNEGNAPTSSLLDHRIRYSWCAKSEDAKSYLLAGGKSMYALQYLIHTLKELMLVCNGSRLAGRALETLPMCLNDTAYDLIRDSLLEQAS